MRYLKKNEIIYFNENTLLTNTPDEIIGVREPGALEMVVNAPKEIIFGQELYPTIYEKAAILMINIATKHVFHNANKDGLYFIKGFYGVKWLRIEHEIPRRDRFCIMGGQRT